MSETAMAVPRTNPQFDFTAYLDWEEIQPEKHEYLRGEVFEMVGARLQHVEVTANLLVLLRTGLRGRGCRAYSSDLKLRIEQADAVFYPDLVVTCDPSDHRASRYIEHPILVVEVLSEFTAAYDRGNKFAAYRTIDSLREYVLVDIDVRRVECFRRDGTGHWVLYEYGRGEQAEFASVGLTVAVDDVFENVEPPAQESAAG